MSRLEIASLLLALTAADDDDCRLSSFARDLQSKMQPGRTLLESATELSHAYGSEEDSLKVSIDRYRAGRDKLLGELHRIESQIQQTERRMRVVEQGKVLCRRALNTIVSENWQLASTASAPLRTHRPVGLPESHNVETPTNVALMPANNQIPKTEKRTVAGSEESRSERTIVGEIRELTSLLSIPDVHDSNVMQGFSKFEDTFKRESWSNEEVKAAQHLIEAIIKHLPLPRPPVQVVELRVLTLVLRQLPSDCSFVDKIFLEASQKAGVTVLVRLLHSVNDDVKLQTVECLGLVVAENESRHLFMRVEGIPPLIAIIASSTNEALLERALVFLWRLLSTDDEIRSEIRRCKGMQAVVELLYTDSMSILENVAMSIGFMTREEESKIEIREGGGLEKITATLRHPLDSIQTKIAGAIWNCASNNENRGYLRQLGCIPALIELLQLPQEHLQENAAGALWNLSVDTENKTQILDFGGIGVLIKILQNSKSDSVIENCSGTLWNCSAVQDNRTAIRKHGGIPVFLTWLQNGNDKIRDNCAGALRNCAISDQNNSAIRAASGVEIALDLLDHVTPPTQEKLFALLWILTSSQDATKTIRHRGGIPRLLSFLTTVQPACQEKIAGLLRNCSCESENRPHMIELKTIEILVQVVRKAGAAASTTLKEACASTLWYLSRDDKHVAAREGGLELLSELLADSNSLVVEQAAGALSTITVNVPENRELAREVGALSKLLQLLVRHAEVSTSHPHDGFSRALLNILIAIRNITSANEKNSRISATYDRVCEVLSLVVSRGTDDFAREAAICIKNLAFEPATVERFFEFGANRSLTNLIEKGSTDAVKKAASAALQSLGRYASRK